MKSLGSSTSDSNESARPSASIAEISSQQVRAALPAAVTNDQAEVAMVQIVAGSVESPDADSASDTESENCDETTSSESTVSPDENCAADDADINRSSKTVSSPAVM